MTYKLQRAQMEVLTKEGYNLKCSCGTYFKVDLHTLENTVWAGPEELVPQCPGCLCLKAPTQGDRKWDTVVVP